MRPIQPLGEGGMGAVWEVEDVRTGQRYAFKYVTANDPDMLLRFRREAEAMAGLNHPHVVRVHSAQLAGDRPYLVQELLRGGTLSDLVGQGPLEGGEARRLARQVAEGVAAAHAQGILHRDLKPENVLLTEDREAKVADFGLASAAAGGGNTLTQTGELLGTPSYMAPEQALDPHAVDERADVYALGAILYTLLTGATPLKTKGRSVLQALAALQFEQPVHPSELNPYTPPDLAAVCLRALQKDPAERYPSAEAFADALTPAGSTPRTWLLWGALALPAVLLALTVAWLFSRPPSQPSNVKQPTSTPAAGDPPPSEPVEEPARAARPSPFLLPASLAGTDRVAGAFFGDQIVLAQNNELTFWDGTSDDTPVRRVTLAATSAAEPHQVLPVSDTELVVCGAGFPIQLVDRAGTAPIGPKDVFCVALREGLLAYGRNSGELGIIQLPSGAPVAAELLIQPDYAVRDVLWLNAGRLVVTTRGRKRDEQGAGMRDADSQLVSVVLEEERLGVADSRELPGRIKVAGAFSLTHTTYPTTGCFVLGTAVSSVTYWNPADERLTRLKEGFNQAFDKRGVCNSAVELPDQRLAVGLSGRLQGVNRIDLYDPRDGSLGTFPLGDLHVDALALDPQGEYLLVCGNGGSFRLIELERFLLEASTR